MKFIIAICLTLLATSTAHAETISFYAQGCLPHVENSSFEFNCADEVDGRLELLPISGSNSLRGQWSKEVELTGTRLTLAIEVTNYQDLGIYIMDAYIRNDQGQDIVSSHHISDSQDSLSLISHAPLGKKNGLPTFHFGRAGVPFRPELREALMKSALSNRRR